MAWYNAGIWDGLPVEQGATLLSQILYAINEREAAQGANVTTWTSPISTDYPSFTDCIMPTSDAYAILQSAQTAINILMNTVSPGNIHFVTNDYSTSWTISSLLSLGSYGTSWLPITTVERARIWLQIREALDLLIYIRSNSLSINTNNTLIADKGIGATQQAAWNDIGSGTGNSIIINNILALREMNKDAGGACTAFAKQDGFIPSFNLPNVIGSSVRIELTFNEHGASNTDTYTVVDSDGTEYPLTKNYSENTIYIKNGSVAFDINPTTTLAITDSLPATQPFSALPAPGLGFRKLDSEYSSCIVVRQLVPGTHLTYG